MATRQELQLATLNLEYSRFVKDQVLTEVQLNEIIDFFEDQHRITRTCLIGTGIVCGLHLKRDANSVSLGEGVAVTTDGDVFKMSNTNYRYFAEYVQSDEAKYDPFYYMQGTDEKAVKLYQLLTSDEKDSITSATVYDITELDSKITNWVGLLYLEYYLKSPEKCTPTNCDNLGRRQVARPLVLLISKNDLDKVVSLDTGEVIGDDLYQKYYEAYEKYFDFPVVRPKRVILNSSNTLQTNTLAGAYFNAAKNGSAALSDAIQKLYDAFKFLIDRDHSVNMANLVTRLNANLNTASNTLYAQYTYDYYKDIATAYNELRDAIYSVAFECIPNLYAFPKHIMLGEPNIKYGPRPPRYRHQFYPSPAVSEHKHLVNTAISMLDRLEAMVLNFNPAEVGPIRITPSKDYSKPLEERAIPFYYDNFSLIAQIWSYRKALKATDKLNLSYNASQYPAPINDEILNPLDYSIDEYDFFRIEGHIGKDYKTVLAQLNDLKNQKGVPIDVVAVRLGDPKLSDINLDDFECQFEDLKTILQAFQVEINCILSEGSNFFSGFTAKQAAPHVNIIRYIPTEGQPPWIINTSIFKTVFNSDLLVNSVNEVTRKAVITTNVNEATTAATNRINATKLTAVNPVINFCDRFINPTFAINQAVKLNIDDHPDSFGKYYLQIMDTSNLSADEFIEKARLAAANDTDLNSLNNDERYVVFEYPTQVIANLNVMQRFVPETITDISQNFITDYRNFSSDFCTRLKIMRTRLERYFRTGNYTARGFESEYMNMIDRLERLCCGNEKLEVVMREIDRRKKLILQNLSFSKYATQHPGLEHKAGSHRGGTFVLVYATSGQTTTTQPVFSAAALKSAAAVKAAAANVQPAVSPAYSDIDSFALHIVTNDETINRDTELNTFFTQNNIVKGSAYAEYVIKALNTRITDISKVICKDLTQPAADVVIADFCLPYFCCSECPPVAFVIAHNEQTSLTLPTDKICNDADPLTFTVIPEDGTVTTKDPALAGTVKKQPDGSIIFDPGAVNWAADQVSVQVLFILNGKDSTCSITVFKRPDAFIQHALTSDDSSLQKQLLVTFTANPNSPNEALTYNWKFNDGQTASGKQVAMTFDKLALAKNGLEVITANLTVTNGTCVTNSEPDSVGYIPYTAPQLALPVSKVCNSAAPVTFSQYAPQGAVVASKEAPDAVIMSNPPAFDPTKVPATILPAIITFTVGGEPTNCTILVTRPVDLALSSKIVDSTNSTLIVQFSNTTNEAVFGKQTYIWDFGIAHEQVISDQTGDFTLNFDMQLLKKNQINVIQAVVTLKDDPCQSKGVVNTEVPQTNDPAQCQKLVSDFINTKLKLLSSADMQKLVKSTDNSQVNDFYNNTIDILKRSLDALNSGNPNQKSALIENIFGLLSQIFIFQVNPDVPNMARVLEELLRTLLMLMFNLVRCDQTIAANDLAMIQRTMARFHEMLDQLRTKYPQLDLKNQLENDVTDYTKSFVSQLADLIKSLQTLIQDLGKFAA